MTGRRLCVMTGYETRGADGLLMVMMVWARLWESEAGRLDEMETGTTGTMGGMLCWVEVRSAALPRGVTGPRVAAVGMTPSGWVPAGACLLSRRAAF